MEWLEADFTMNAGFTTIPGKFEFHQSAAIIALI